MKRRSVVLAGALGLTGLAVPALGQAPDLAKLREELMELEKGSWGFMRDKNTAGMQAYLADDGLLIFADGSRYNKREILALMPHFRLDSVSYEPTYAARVIAPDVVTLLYRVTYTASVKGAPAETVKALSSSVYVWRNNKWWAILYQESPVK